jgi:hypothetical protein
MTGAARRRPVPEIRGGSRIRDAGQQILGGGGVIHIIYQADHKKRAEALQAANPGSLISEVGDTPFGRGSVDTLVYWGHGDAYKFCTMEADAFLANIRAWQKMNPNIRTVEVITCNARHGFEGAEIRASFTDQIKKQWRKKFSGMIMKALPMGVSKGQVNSWSILKYQDTTKTWYYVTAPGAKDTQHMWPGCHEIEAAVGNGLHEKAQAASANTRCFNDTATTEIYTLRSSLVVINR